MKYELLGKFRNDLITTILNNRGIFDVEKILKPTRENDTDISTIQNIYNGVNLVKNNINNKILIEVDSDVDGFTSGAIMYKTLKAINPASEIYTYIHNKKQHGITKEFLDYVEQLQPNLIIIPDAGTNDIEGRKKIVDWGIELLIIDHHTSQHEEVYDSGVIINNQLDDTNKHLTGAGMVYLFCKLLEKEFNLNEVEKLKDLTMLGLIGDNASLIDNEIRNLCTEGISEINSNLIKTFYENSDDLSFKDMSFGGIIPAINAVVRVGGEKEKRMMFNALADIDTDYCEIIEKRKLNKETRKYEMIPFNMNTYELAIEYSNKCKNKQNAIMKKEVTNSQKQFNPNTGVQIYITDNEEAKSITGLLANKLKSQWEQPVLVLWLNDEGTTYNGSMRGCEKTISNFQKWCLSTGKFNFVQGHPNAAGVSICAENLESFIKCCETIESEELIYKVDVEYEENANINHIYELHNNKKIFGNGIDEPIFAINNLRTPVSNLRWSKKTMRISLNFVTYVFFGIEEEKFNEIKSLVTNDSLTFNIIGRFDVNEWNGKKYPQVIVTDWEILTQKEETETNNPFIIPNVETKPKVDYGIFA